MIKWLSVVEQAIKARGESERLRIQARELQEVSWATVGESKKVVQKSKQILFKCEKNRSLWSAAWKKTASYKN